MFRWLTPNPGLLSACAPATQVFRALRPRAELAQAVELLLNQSTANDAILRGLTDGAGATQTNTNFTKAKPPESVASLTDAEIGTLGPDDLIVTFHSSPYINVAAVAVGTLALSAAFILVVLPPEWLNHRIGTGSYQMHTRADSAAILLALCSVPFWM